MNQRQADFESLIARNRGRLLAIARAYGDMERDDLLQEILLQVWRSMDRFENRSSPDTWCYRIALNTAFSWLRSQQRRNDRLKVVSNETDSVPGAPQVDDSVRLLERFMRELNPIDRAVLLMFLENLSEESIAETLGSSIGAIRVRLHRIKSRLTDWKDEP
ncbi:MAG: RNA polymerase sigma factor [Pirellulales bacterium]